MTTLSRTTAAAALLFVLAAYAFFATAGRFAFPEATPRYSVYADLAEGFLRGQVSLSSVPSPELRALRNPYEFRNRHNIPYIWDASYFEGRYYLYFSALPVLLFTIPYYLIIGAFPADTLVSLFFAAWALIAATAFVLGARRGESWTLPPGLWILLLGLGGFVPFVLTVAGAPYQTAILCGMAVTATWAYSLLAYAQRPATWRAAAVAFWAAMSVAARPNLALLVVITAIALWRTAPPVQRIRHLIVSAVPVACIALALMTYNFVRFENPLEFGVRYQLGADLIVDRICGLASGQELVRFVNMAGHHVLQPPTFAGDFPWADLPWSRVDPRTSPGSEQSGGIGAVTPLVLMASVLLLAGFGQNRGARGSAANHVMIAAWAILLSVSTCWFVATRYSLDYAMLMTAATIVTMESILATASRRRRLIVVTVALILYSSTAGVLLGFQGPYDAFEKRNPRLFHKLSAAFGGPRIQLIPRHPVRLRGWAVHVNGPVELAVQNSDGTPAEGARVRRLPSPDVYEHFSKKWKPFEPLRNARFEVDAPSRDCELVLLFENREVQRIPLQAYPAIVLQPDIRLSIETFEVRAEEE